MPTHFPELLPTILLGLRIQMLLWKLIVCYSTFGQSYGSKVVHVHDGLVQLQRHVLHRSFHLHAAVDDEDVQAAVAFQHLWDHIRQALHVTEVNQHQFGREGLQIGGTGHEKAGWESFTVLSIHLFILKFIHSFIHSFMWEQISDFNRM